jgi:hypothetical protein
MPKKGDIVINPNTQRPVKVGSRTWLNLVKKGVFEGTYEDPNELYSIQSGDEIEEKLTEINQKLPKGKHAVRGRGKYKNKLVVRNKRLSVDEIADYTRKNTIKTFADNLDELTNLSNEEIEKKLEELIMKEMMRDPHVSTTNKKKKSKKQQHYMQAEQKNQDEYECLEDVIYKSEEDNEQSDEIDFDDVVDDIDNYVFDDADFESD